MIEIVPFARHHAEGVVAVILPIQQSEFEIPISLEDQPDLLDVPGFYRRGAGNFWVATDGGEVVGTVALLDIGERRAALRKMFVRATHRGAERGVAQRLLETLLEWCRAHALREVILGTTAKFLAASLSEVTRAGGRALSPTLGFASLRAFGLRTADSRPAV